MAKAKKEADKFTIMKNTFVYGGKKADYERGDYYLLPTDIMKHTEDFEDIELHLGKKVLSTTLAWARSNWKPDIEGWLVPKSIFADDKKKRQTK